MPPRDAFLIRHAESEWNAVGRWQGQADPPLSAHGREQAQALAEAFPFTAPAPRVFASDLVRAWDTALPLCSRIGVDPDVDVDLREIDVGSWSGRTRAEIGAEDPGALAQYFQGKAGWTGGESYEQHEARAARFVERVEALDDGPPVVAVTHGGTLRALLLAFLDLDADLRWRFSGIGHTSVTWLRRGDHGWTLRAFNSTATGLLSTKSGAIL